MSGCLSVQEPMGGLALPSDRKDRTGPGRSVQPTTSTLRLWVLGETWVTQGPYPPMAQSEGHPEAPYLRSVPIQPAPRTPPAGGLQADLRPGRTAALTCPLSLSLHHGNLLSGMPSTWRLCHPLSSASPDQRGKH